MQSQVQTRKKATKSDLFQRSILAVIHVTQRILTDRCRSRISQSELTDRRQCRSLQFPRTEWIADESTCSQRRSHVESSVTSSGQRTSAERTEQLVERHQSALAEFGSECDVQSAEQRFRRFRQIERVERNNEPQPQQRSVRIGSCCGRSAATVGVEQQFGVKRIRRHQSIGGDGSQLAQSLVRHVSVRPERINRRQCIVPLQLVRQQLGLGSVTVSRHFRCPFHVQLERGRCFAEETVGRTFDGTIVELVNRFRSEFSTHRSIERQ
jgi:hypothetical protein